MKSLTFSPRGSTDEKPDTIARTLFSTATYLFVLLLSISPLLLLPLEAAPFGYTKIIVVTVGILAAFTLFSLSVLRTGRLHVQITAPALLLWGVVIATALSALFSGDLADAFTGTNIESQTVVFLSILALIVTASHFFLYSKQNVIHLYMLLFGTATILAVYHISRLLMGPEFLSFGLATSELFTPVGNWNDLGIFFALIVVFTVVILEQLPLPKSIQYLFAFIAVLALGILVVVQFTTVWVLLGLFGLISLMFSLTRHRFNSDYHSSTVSMVLSGAITVIALVLILGGNTLGSQISSTTGINQTEVRPSLTATIGIAQNVYSDNALFGIGPNKFSDAWRLHRDASLNNTVFWNTDFIAGNSYVATAMTTGGALVAVAWLIFFTSLFVVGYRLFLRSQQHDPFWHFAATSSFIGTAFLWLMSILYVPGPLIMLLAALSTGIMLVSYCNLSRVPVLNFDSTKNRQATVVLLTAVLLVVLGSISASYSILNHYSATFTFNSAFTTNDLETSNQRLEQAFALHPHASYARARARNAVVELNQLLQQDNADDSTQQAFEEALVAGVTAGQQATNRDPQDAQNWAIQSAVYGALAGAEIDGAADRGYTAIAEAQRLYPSNPEYHALEAQIAFRANDTERARTALNEALRRKPDYLAALSLLTELDILTGDIATAQQNVQGMIRLQPNNAGLHYQLAILYLANDETGSAITALEQAVRIDPDFANARYVLALQYADQNRDSEALEQLERVRALNPDNESVRSLIERIEAGESIDDLVDTTPESSADIVPDIEPENTSAATPDTDLIQSVNQTTEEESQPENTSEPQLQAPESSSENE